MSLNGRLERLERDIDKGCLRCGGGPGAVGVRWAEEPDEGPERCPGCGRPPAVRLQWTDGIAGADGGE